MPPGRSQRVWNLRSWSDVSAGLACDHLVIAPGALAVESPEPMLAGHALHPANLEQEARRLAGALPPGRRVDLYQSVAEPWALGVAAAVLGIPVQDAERLVPVSRTVFEAAARATGSGTSPAALEAAMDLAGHLPGSPLAVQSFVALAHTLPHFLAAAWHLLLSVPEEMDRLRREGERMPRVMEELLRLAGPSRVVYRVAEGAAEIGAARIEPGDDVHLHLAAANRDPARFTEPERFNPDRAEGGHLAFGRGRHACAGAQLIRHAAQSATAALLAECRAMTPAGDPDWLTGPAIAAPVTLPVVVSH